MKRALLLIGLLGSAVSLAEAQTTISGTALCAPSNPVYMVRVGDHTGHAYGLAQGTCTWTKPWEIAGVKNTEGTGTQIQEINGDSMKVRGTFVDAMANGDKVYYSFEFTAVTKADGPHILGHKWEMLGGTGKFSGARGQGTCKGAPAGNAGSVNYECGGQYTLARQ